jgi:mitogen-activated protein kinase 1/3
MDASKSGWNLGSKYELLKKIGRGSFGIVYLVKEVATNNRYAAKMISGIFDDAIDAKRLLREISILKEMQHPNIVGVHDVIIPNQENELFNTAIIIMEAV